MVIKPIRTASDLHLAKCRLAELLKANGEGAYDDEIEVLSALIEQSERTQYHIDAPSPVAAIKYRMREMGMSPRQLEPFIGSRARVSEVLSGKRQLSLEMIRSIHEGLGVPYESLISKRPRVDISEQGSSPAIDRLNQLGFDVERSEVAAFLGSLARAVPSSVLHRKTRTQRAATKMDQTALLLWQAAVLKRSAAQPVRQAFISSSFGADVLRRTARLSTRADGPIRAVNLLADLGIAVVIVPSLPGAFLDGAAMALPSGNPVIGLTLRYDRTDSFWFTLLHECAHVSLHYDHLRGGEVAFVDDMEIRSDDAFECEADDLARESLIPKQVLNQIHWNEDTTQDEIVALAVRARVHLAIAAGRWQRDHQNYKKFSRLIERGVVRAALGLA